MISRCFESLGVAHRLGVLIMLLGTLGLSGCAPGEEAPRREPVSKLAAAAGSCVGFCGGQSSDGCWCDSSCSDFGDCCGDFEPVCVNPPPPEPGSCVGFCGGQSSDGCWCNDQCAQFGDCCDDFDSVCSSPPPDPDPTPADDSCEDRCGTQAPAGCWCDDSCANFGDCCADRDAFCSGEPPPPPPPPGGSDPWEGLSDGALKSALGSETTSGHSGFGYTEARNFMYGITGPGIDVHNGVIEGIYTGVTAAPDGTRTPGGLLNTEHSWPQSDGAGSLPAKGDLHHLFPSQQDANSRRSSHPFGETTCTGSSCPWDLGGSELGTSGSGQTVFQVRTKYRGDVARAHFYFSVRYGMSIPANEEVVLKVWNDQDPPDTRERDRNDAIEAIQGNRNPFVDYPHLDDRISDF